GADALEAAQRLGELAALEARRPDALAEAVPVRVAARRHGGARLAEDRVEHDHRLPEITRRARRATASPARAAASRRAAAPARRPSAPSACGGDAPSSPRAAARRSDRRRARGF